VVFYNGFKSEMSIDWFAPLACITEGNPEVQSSPTGLVGEKNDEPLIVRHHRVKRPKGFTIE
jgi:hypothetical protein